uniref:Uncharacterized protein n=1 Tax=Bionectria ochroleuca TaxID=29856 RepID=A0A0B7KNQ6_BIOOC
MALAIGSIGLFRDGRSSLHPFGFFTAALEACPPLDSSFDSVDDLECFLLIARFGVAPFGSLGDFASGSQLN